MKIAIVTFQKSMNYGTNLQAFALQSFLRTRGFDVETIDYQNPSEVRTNLKGFKRLRSEIWNRTLYPLFESKERIQRTEAFRAKYVSLSSRQYTSHQELYDANDIYDVFISGSDQIWNPVFNRCDYKYFLDFVTGDNKRIAYAPSFGTPTVDEKYLGECLPLIKQYTDISMREESGAEIVSAALGREVCTVLDPVFLPEKKTWEEIASEQLLGEYIFCYIMPGDKNSELAITLKAEAISKLTGLPIVYLGKKVYDKLNLKDRKANRFDDGPSEWISLLKNANYVVTNSFHGTAFSILFHKTFFVPMYTELPGGGLLYTRIKEMLDKFELQKPIINAADLSNINSELYDLDYEAADQTIATHQEQSRNFLISSITR